MTPLRLRDRLRRLPAGEVIVRLGVFVLGALFIGLGLALSVLPGPFTIPPVLVGLLIWSLEFEFAERWLDKAKAQAQQAWDGAQERPWRAGLSLVASLALLVGGLLLAAKYELMDRVTGLVS